MEDAFYGNSSNLNNLTDDETLRVPEGEDNIQEECSMDLEDKMSSMNRKASMAMGCNQGQEAEDEEKWRRGQEEEIFFQFSESCIQVIEKEEWRFIGEVKNEMREGFGVCYYKNGDVYRGQWKMDKREGLGVLTFSNGDILRGELEDDKFSGYCEFLIPYLKYSIEGLYSNNEFYDQVIVKNNSSIYEGDVLPKNSFISIGKLTYPKKPGKIFMGEIKNYRDEEGLGIFINNSTMYLGEIHDKLLENYIEMVNLDGSAHFFFVKKSLKEGFSFSFSKDGRVGFGKYLDNCRNGPFFTFSNCHNLAKSSVRMEIYFLDFKTKVVDKMEPSKKYLNTYFPEFTSILSINYNEIITRLNEVISEEIAFLNSKIPKEDKNE